MTNPDGQSKYRLQITLTARLAVLPLTTFPGPHERTCYLLAWYTNTSTPRRPSSWRVAWPGLAGEEQLLLFNFNPSLAGFKCCLWWQLAAEASFVQTSKLCGRPRGWWRRSNHRRSQERFLQQTRLFCWGGWGWRGCCVLGAEDKSIEEFDMVIAVRIQKWICWRWCLPVCNNSTASRNFFFLKESPPKSFSCNLQGQIACWAPSMYKRQKTVGLLQKCMHCSIGVGGREEH